MSRPRPPLITLLLASFFASGLAAEPASGRTAQDDATTIIAPEAGFRLTIPDVGWGHRTQRSGDGLSAVVAGPEASAGYVQLSIQITAGRDGSDEAVIQQLRQLRAAIASEAGITEVEDYRLEVAGHTARGLRLVQAAFGEVFRVHLVFLRARGIQYRIQFHAPRDAFDEHWTTAQRVLAGFELIELDAEAAKRAQLHRLAARCGSQVDWASDWEEASRRARRDGRLIVVSVYAQPGFDIGNALNEGPFMNPDVLALIGHRFVAWRWSSGLPAPFVSPDVFGLGGNTFGAGLLICTPDGAVVGQVFLLDRFLVADALRRLLGEHPDLAPPPARTTGTRAERTAFLIDSGQLAAARLLLGRPAADEPADVAFQRARWHRIDRDGAAALAALEGARRSAAAPSAPSPAALLLEEAAVHIGLGRTAEAADVLKRCLESDPQDRERAEAMLLQGLLAWAGGDAEGARDGWTTLAVDLPDQPAAWQAAAGVVGPALDMGIAPDVTWPSPIADGLARLPDPAPESAPLEIAPGLFRAVDWLAEQQRPDGGWDTTTSIKNTQPAPHELTMASQAIVVHALTRAAAACAATDPVRADRYRGAARSGLNRYLADRDLSREHPRPVAFMDYTCWASSYGLRCLTAILDPGLAFARGGEHGTRDELRAEAASLVGDLVRIQQANGGWSYYLSGQVDGEAVVAAMSFTTATVLLALESARDREIDVPQAVLERGYACLERMRGPNGVWEYLRFGAAPTPAGVVDPAGAAARGPVCTHALLRGGRLGAAAMAPALKIYVEHLGSFGAEARKALMHAGPAGQGSHYLLYDYSTAAEALRAVGEGALDADSRRRARAAILREMQRCRSVDGSFLDNPIIGSAAGTGLAALALVDLLEDPAVTAP